MRKKIMRGISKDFAETIRKGELYKLYENHKDELIIGVRNNYLNLYYNCDNIAKIAYTKGSILCEIDKYYLDGKHYKRGSKEKQYKIEQREICNQYEEIKKHSNNKVTQEKKAQSKLVLLNNGNKDSNWFCIDVEYVKAFNNDKEKKRGILEGDLILLRFPKKNLIGLH